MGANPLPLVFSKIEHNRFILQGYNLSKQTLAISGALAANTNKFTLIKTLALDDCSVGDLGFSLILKGIIK